MTDDKRADIRRFLRCVSAEKQDDLFLRYGILQRCHQLDLSIAPSEDATSLSEYLLEACRGDRLTKREFSNLPSFPSDLQACRESLRAAQTTAVDERRRRSSSTALFDGLLPVEDSPQSSITSSEATTTLQLRYRCDSVTLGRDSHRPVRANDYDQRGVSHISCGVHHTLVVTDDGRLWASGDHNSNGRLGTGDEIPRATPVVIATHMVLAAAGDTHSLALTNAGVVYAFGSNRFGQVGASPSLKPRRIDLKVRIIAIAAGARHSLALCEDGFVYGWGDNSAGQLGSAVLRNSNRKVHRIESLHEIIAVSAADQSTIALTARHTVYAWGHGNPVPTKVVIAATITAISAAKHHNVALANDGSVYAWGLHGDSLGSAQRSQTRVQRVELPEPAVAIAASEYHTAVITAQGHLYTFGDASDTNIMGHAGVRWQPEPKQVPGVYRAVGVAAAKEHMAIMISTTVPPVPPATPWSLADLAARKLAQQVDLFNVVSILIVAERTQSQYLLAYCREFVERNLDGILNVAQKAVMQRYLQEQILNAQPQGQEDELTQIIMAGTRPGRSLCTLNEWIEAVFQLIELDSAVGEVWTKLSADPTSTNSRRGITSLESEIGGRCRKESFAERSSIDLDDLVVCTKELASDTLAMLNKEARAIRKRLGQIDKLEAIESRTLDQERKIARKPQLESDLEALGPAILRVEAKIRSLVLLDDQQDGDTETADECAKGTTSVCDTDGPEDEGVAAAPEEDQKPRAKMLLDEESVADVDSNIDEGGLQSLRCDVCGVKCSDSSSYFSHIHGRKHRNKIAQTVQEEEDHAAASLLENQRIKAFQKHEVVRIDKLKAPVSVWKKGSPSTAPFKLPPPPHPVVELVRKQAPKSVEQQVSSPVAKPGDTRVEVAALKLAPNTLKPPPSTPSPMKSPPWASAPFVSLAETESPQNSLLRIMQEESRQSKPKLSAKSQAMQKKNCASRGTPTRLKELPEPSSSNSLNEFLPSAAQKHIPTKRWGIPAPPVAKASPATTVSLKEIQKQEETFQTKQDHSYANNGQWFVERRERANSLKEIQKSAVAEREEQDLIEEQKRIEAQIYAEIKAKKEAEERAKKNKQKKRARKKAALKKQQASNKNSVSET